MPFPNAFQPSVKHTCPFLFSMVKRPPSAPLIYNCHALALAVDVASKWKICQLGITRKLHSTSGVSAVNALILKDGRHCVGLNRVRFDITEREVEN
ncbi:hypothetical protein SLA2020_080460 [Shorea laevis]